MRGHEDALALKIRELRYTFLERFPRRMEEARAAFSDLEKGDGGRGALSLKALLHTLKGTGESLGLGELGALAREAEALLERTRAAEEEKVQPLLRALESRLADLSAAAASALELEVRPQASAGAGAAAATEELPLVYLCDDDAIQAAVIASQVSYFGYKVEVYTRTADLLDATLAQRPRAIIMDIVFPEGASEGADALRRLRERGVELPTLFISARSDFEARLSAVRAGGSAYFPKPIDPMKLVSSLDELTKLREPEPFRILIVDDEPVAAEYHRSLLAGAGMEVRATQDPESALAIVREFRPDLVLMDIYMPGCSGHELAALIRQIPDFLSIPIIFLSAEQDRGKQLSALSVGADGFLTKPIPPAELVASVSLRAERMRILRSLMTQDSLTGLYNHTMSTQLLRSALDATRRSGSSVCFAMIDIDDFKRVNDSYGHPVGDQVLIAIARALRQRLRTSDVVGRYGGEEFAVVLPDTTRESARVLLDLLREDFSRVEFRSEDRVFHCSFSCGLASSLDYPTLESIREAADRSLYQAKAAGKNRILLAAPERGPGQ